MAKTFRNLYAELTSFENLWEAYRKARRGKRYDEPAAWFDFRVEANLLALRRELVERTYAPGAYNNFHIWEPKRRLISAAPFRDRVVHHALVNILEPIYEPRFSTRSYACRVGKGTHRAIAHAHAGVRQIAWLLKGDIVKFFPSVDHEVLRGVLSRTIADPAVRWLIGTILRSGEGVFAEEACPQWFAGDDLLGRFAGQFPGVCVRGGYRARAHAWGLAGEGDRNMIVRLAGVAGRLVQQRAGHRALRQPRQEHTDERERQQRLSCGFGCGALSRRMEFAGLKSFAARASSGLSVSIPVSVSCPGSSSRAKTRRGGGAGSPRAKVPPPPSTRKGPG
jgi:hypothetical protein